MKQAGASSFADLRIRLIRISAKHVAHQGDELERAGIADSVVDAIRVLAGSQHILVAQDSEVLGDIALRGADGIHDFLNTDFLVA